MSYPTREERAKCWSAKDRYWQCLDEKNIKGSPEANNATVCAEFRKTYENSCLPQWVKHFDRKRNYLVFKNKIENEGYEPLDESKYE